MEVETDISLWNTSKRKSACIYITTTFIHVNSFKYA